MAIPMLTLIIKLNKWSESAKFFDGSALGESALERLGGGNSWAVWRPEAEWPRLVERRRMAHPRLGACASFRLVSPVASSPAALFAVRVLCPSVAALSLAQSGCDQTLLQLLRHTHRTSLDIQPPLTPAMMTGCVVLYLSVHIHSLRTFLPDAKSTWSIIPSPPPLEKPFTEAEKTEAVRVLAAGNALVALLLVGVIGMQIGQEYAHHLEAKEQKAIDEAAARSDAEDKKNI